jgi:protein TonB
MNDDEKNKDFKDPAQAGMEERIIAWLSGECSAEESAEIARLCAADPGLAAFRERIERVQALAAAAGSPDRDPLRLSGERRAVLLGALSAADLQTLQAPRGAATPRLSQLPTIMRRLNLAYAAVFSVVLIAGVTWWGERTHYVAALLKREPLPTTVEFTVEPDKPIPVESTDPEVKKPKEEIPVPAQDDTPLKPKTDDFTQKIEPPHPAVTIPMDRIPIAVDSDPSAHVFDPSQLEQQPEAKFQPRPVYPYALKRDGIVGEVTVDFVIDPDGDVRNVVAVRSSQSEFAESACTAVAKWKFRPGKRGGRAVYSHMRVPIIFSLSQDDGR